MSLKERAVEYLKGWLTLALLAGALGLAAIAWPVSGWLVAAFAAHWVLRLLADRMLLARLQGRPSLLRTLVEIGARSLERATVYVGLGIALVALAQAALWAAAQLVEPAIVRRAEEWLSWSYQSLLSVLDIKVLAAMLAVLVAVTFVAPRLGVVGRFLALRNWVSRVALVLAAITSFTFFGALDMEQLDPEWRAAQRYLARARFASIDEQARQTAAAMWVESEARRLDAEKRQEFQRFFTGVRGLNLSTEIVRAAAAELAGKAPKLAARPAHSEGEIIPERVKAYLQAEAPPPAVAEQPTLTELRGANERLAAHELKARAARTAAIELAAEAITEFIPRSEKALVNAFVQELAGSLSKGALREVVPSRAADVAVAKDWVKANLGAAAVEKGALPHAWSFHPSALETRAAGTGVRTGELLIAALLSRLHGQAIQRQQALSALRSLPTGSVPSSSSSRVRVRR